MPANVPHPEHVLRGHKGEVQALDFDDSERLLVTGDSLGEVRVWRLGNLRPAAIRKLHPLAGGILSLCLFKSAESQLLGTQGRDGTTLLWSFNSEDLQISDEPVRSFVRDCYSFCRFSVLAADEPPSGGANSAIDELQQQQQQQQQQVDDFVAAVVGNDSDASVKALGAAQPEPGADQEQQAGQQADSQQADGASRAAGPAIWALHPCSQASEQHPPALLAIPGGDERIAEVVCCSCGCQVAEFSEQEAGRKLGMLMAIQLYCAPQQPPEAACGSPSPPRICLAAGYEDGSVVIWVLGAPPRSPPLMQRQLCSEPVMALTVDASCTGGVAGSAEDQVAVFKLDHGKQRLSLRYAIELQKRGIGDVAVRPDRKLLTTAGWDGRVRVYKYKSGRPLAILKYHASAVTGLHFGPRSMLLATAARDGTVALWPIFQPEEQ